MKIKLLIMTLILGLFLVHIVSATCTVTFGKEYYFPSETITATMSCNLGNEKNQAYTLNWTYQNGTQLELDTGTTPTTSLQNFFETYVIPSNHPLGIFINATLQGTNLEGTDSANVTAGGTNSLVIKNIGLTSANDTRLGKTLGIEFEVNDENSKKVSNAKCQIDIEDGIGNPLVSKLGVSHAGRVDAEFLLAPETFTEDRSYLIALKCFCGQNNTDLTCIDEDGAAVTNSVGEDNSAFNIIKWLTVNTVTDKSIYEMKNTIFVCSNVTNSNIESLPIHIYNQVRCSAGTDNNNDLDRTLIISDGSSYDHRRISNETTQMQCKEFLIPEIRHLEGRNSQCYATTRVWIVDEKNKEIKGYSTTSPVFNITSDELNIPADWERISNYTFNTIINLSNTRYSDWNGNGTGNIDVVIDSTKGEAFDPRTTRSIPSISLESLFLSNQIKSITAVNGTGGTITNGLEYLEDGKIEIELRNVDLSQNGYYNITIVFHNYEERETESLENSTWQLSRSATALEGIENKTGTFHLDINCPSSGTIGSDIACIITAYIEDSQTVQKEVDFTCYISDGTNSYSSTNFNQMITRNAVSLSRTFAVPSSFSSGTQYTLQCNADYYNLGSRRDSFYDTFTATSASSIGGGSSWYSTGGNGSGITQITGRAIYEGDEKGDEDKDMEDIVGKFNPFSPNRNWVFIFIETIVLIWIIISLIYLLIGKRKKESHCYHHHYKNKWKKIIRRMFLILLLLIIISGIILGIFYGYKYIKNTISDSPEGISNVNNEGIETSLPQSYSIFQDPLLRGIILTVSIILMIVILFKAINIRGEIKFGHDYSTRKYYDDKKSAKLQQKLNQIMLKNEIKRQARKEDYKVRKMTLKEFKEFIGKK